MIETDNSIAGPTTNPSLVCNSHKSFRYFQIYIWNSYLCWAFVRLSQKSLNRITCACVWYIKNYTKHFIGEEIFDTFEFYISPECEMTTVDSAWYKCFLKNVNSKNRVHMMSTHWYWYCTFCPLYLLSLVCVKSLQKSSLNFPTPVCIDSGKAWLS